MQRFTPLTPYFLPFLYMVTLSMLALLLEREYLVSFFRDDSFFYLKTAHNFNEFNRFTFDGVNQTDGFHHLYMWMLVITDRLAPLEGVEGLRVTMLLHGLFVFLAAVMAGEFLKRHVGMVWRIVGSAYVIGLAVFVDVGTESALLLLVALAYLLALAVQMERLSDESKWRPMLLTALLSAAVCLARTDAFVWVAALGGVAGVYAWRAKDHQRMRAVLFSAIAPALLVLVVGALVNLLQSGHIETISASVKNDFPDFLNNEWFAGVPASIKARLVLPVPIALLVLFIAVRRSLNREVFGDRSDLSVWLVGLNLYVVAYASILYLFGAFDLQSWYFVLILTVVSFDITFLAKEASDLVAARLPFSVGSVTTRSVATLVAAVVILLLIAQSYGHLYSSRLSTPGFTNSLRVADWIRSNLAADVRLYMIDGSGRVSYFGERPVVNGDGLINSWSYREAVRTGRLESWLRDGGVDFFVLGSGILTTIPEDKSEGRWVRDLEIFSAPRIELSGEMRDAIYGVEDVYYWIFPFDAVNFSVQEP